MSNDPSFKRLNSLKRFFTQQINELKLLLNTESSGKEPRMSDETKAALDKKLEDLTADRLDLIRKLKRMKVDIVLTQASKVSSEYRSANSFVDITLKEANKAALSLKEIAFLGQKKKKITKKKNDSEFRKEENNTY